MADIEVDELRNERGRLLKVAVKDGVRIINDMTTVKNKMDQLLADMIADGYSVEDQSRVTVRLGQMKTLLTNLANTI